MTVLMKASSRLPYQTREPLDCTCLSCHIRTRVKPKYSKKNLTECHFMPALFQCSDMKKTGWHSLCLWVNLTHWAILMWFDFCVLWQFPKRRSVDTCSGYIIRQYSAELNESRELTISLYISAFVLSMSANISPYFYTGFNLKCR